MKTPTLFGFPLWKGMKTRVAKKYLHYYWKYPKFTDLLYWQQKMSNTKIGDIIYTCAGINGKILAIRPEYYSIKGGKILIDLEIETTATTCSYRHCGVELAKTKEQVTESIQEILSHPQAEQFGWTARFGPQNCTVNEDGTCAFIVR